MTKPTQRDVKLSEAQERVLVKLSDGWTLRRAQRRFRGAWTLAHDDTPIGSEITVHVRTVERLENLGLIAQTAELTQAGRALLGDKG